MERLGAGVIGLHMGGGHLAGYAQNPYVEIRGICDLDRKLLAEKAEQYKVKFTTTCWQDLLKREDIDLVSVSTPDYLHAEQCIAALRAGKNVLCEKPMVTSIKECEAIIKTQEQTGKQFMIGQICRFAPGFQLTKKLIEEGKIGELFFVESEYAHNYSGVAGAGEWRKSREHLRQPFLGGGCHAVDLLRWIAGEAEEAFAYSNHKALLDWPVDDCTVAIFKFKKNIIGKAFVSIGCQRPYTMRSVFWGTKGTIISDNTSAQIKIASLENIKPEERAPSFIEIPVDIASHNIKAEVNEFIDCIIGRKPLLMDAREGAKTVATCLAAVESVSSGKRQKIKVF